MSDLPSIVNNQATNTIAFDPTVSDAVCYLKLDEWMVKRVSREAQIDVRLPSWEAGPVFLSVFLIRVDREPMQTYEHWLNPGLPSAGETLKALARNQDLTIGLVTDRLVRRVRQFNSLRRRALQLFQRLGRQGGTWNMPRYEEARDQVSRLYPGPTDLWRVGASVGLQRLSQ